ncbi:MAG: TIGR00266 family protein [archaeon]
MKYTISGTVMQAVNVELKKGETMYSESGNMAWMSDNIDMETTTRGGFVEGIKRRLSGESIFMNTFRCSCGTGIVTFASEFPGKVLPVQMKKGKELICQKDAFMCAVESVKLEMFFRKRLGVGFFGGEGFILQKLSGSGVAFVELAGEITEITLKKDQVIRADTGYVAMYEPTVDFDIQMVSGSKNIFFGGEGLFLARLTGPGRVWLQSMPIANLSKKIGQYLVRGSRGGLSRLAELGKGI